MKGEVARKGLFYLYLHAHQILDQKLEYFQTHDGLWGAIP